MKTEYWEYDEYETYITCGLCGEDNVSGLAEGNDGDSFKCDYCNGESIIGQDYLETNDKDRV